MSAVDPFRMIDRLDEPILQIIGARLEARGKHALFAKREYVDAMHIDAATTVLDMGCGQPHHVPRRRYATPRFLGRDIDAVVAHTLMSHSRSCRKQCGW